MYSVCTIARSSLLTAMPVSVIEAQLELDFNGFESDSSCTTSNCKRSVGFNSSSAFARCLRYTSYLQAYPAAFREKGELE